MAKARRAGLGPAIREYFTVTRRPLYAVILSAPFFVAYELGILLLLPLQPPDGRVRNKAEVILHLPASALGHHLGFILPVLAGMGLLFYLDWRERRARRSRGQAPDQAVRPGFIPWMFAESVVLAVPLLFLPEELAKVLSAATEGAAGAAGAAHAGLFRLTTVCGAGAYEELLFRLFIFWGFLWLGTELLGLHKLAAGILAAVIGGLLFALFHPEGNFFSPSFSPLFFAFATLAGIYFSAVCYFRSFGLAVAAHASYDILTMLPLIFG